MTRTHTTLLAASLIAAAAAPTMTLAQDLTHKAPPQTKSVLVTNVTLHPVSGPQVADGFIIFEQGKIVGLGSVGKMELAAKDREASGWRVIEGKGLHVYPGLISPWSQLGLTEIQAVQAGIDTSETGGVTPEVRATTAVNPDSTLLPVTRSNGVLIAGVFPDGGTISGQPGVIRLDGWTIEDMAIKRTIGQALRWPSQRAINAWWMERSEEDQLRDSRRGIETIEKTFDTAAAYIAGKDADAKAVSDLRWEAMRPVFPTPVFPTKDAAASGDAKSQKAPEQRIFVTAGDVEQINAAVAFCIGRGMKPVILGGTDAPLCADLLKKHDIPVVVMGTHGLPRRDDLPYDDVYTLPARLHEAGIRFTITNRDDTAHERNLPYAAAMAAAHGLPKEEALRAITLSAAEVLGIADQYGSLDVGKSATLLITNGDPLEVTTTITHAFIDGREIDLSNKHTKLYEKYRERYEQMGEIKTDKK